MTNEDLFKLVFFSKRPGMYLGNHEIKSIEGFLIGFEMANNEEISFHRMLMQNIFNRHRNILEIAEMEKGNVHLLFRQIEEITKKTKIPELQIFKAEAMLCLIEISDNNGQQQFKQILKSKVVETINQDLKNLLNQKDENSRTMSSIIQLHKIIEEWEGENLNIKTRELILQLKDLQINSLTGWMRNPDSEDRSEKIKDISNQILDQLNG